MEDNEIIELYWNRSQQAIVETSIKYGKQLHTLAERILYNHEDSEECVNDTYHIAWNTLPPNVRTISLPIWLKSPEISVSVN